MNTKFWADFGSALLCVCCDAKTGRERAIGDQSLLSSISCKKWRRLLLHLHPSGHRKTTDLTSDAKALVLTQATHRSIPLPPLNRAHRALCDPPGQKGWKVQSLSLPRWKHKDRKRAAGHFFPPLDQLSAKWSVNPMNVREELCKMMLEETRSPGLEREEEFVCRLEEGLQSQTAIYEFSK